MEGIHHQSNITFVINTQDMTLINSDMPYCSHSFNQFVVMTALMYIFWIMGMLVTEV